MATLPLTERISSIGTLAAIKVDDHEGNDSQRHGRSEQWSTIDSHEVVLELPFFHGAFKDLVHVPGCATVQRSVARRIGHQATGVRKLRESIHPRQPVLCCELDDSRLININDRCWDRKEGLGAFLCCCFECAIEVVGGSHLQGLK